MLASRFDENMTDSDLDHFASSLKKSAFTHKDVMRCYSIYMRNEYQKKKDNPLFQATHDGFIRQRAGGKRIPVRWSQAEVDALLEGVKTLGKGNWSKIVQTYPNVFGPTARTGRDLKKKWSTLKKKVGKMAASSSVNKANAGNNTNYVKFVNSNENNGNRNHSQEG